jgi:hypothetical protein
MVTGNVNATWQSPPRRSTGMNVTVGPTRIPSAGKLVSERTPRPFRDHQSSRRRTRNPRSSYPSARAFSSQLVGKDVSARRHHATWFGGRERRCTYVEGSSSLERAWARCQGPAIPVESIQPIEDGFTITMQACSCPKSPSSPTLSPKVLALIPAQPTLRQSLCRSSA